MNVIFIEPSFPYNQREFVRGLHETGANVIGIGERPQEHLADDIKDWLSHYVQVSSVVHEPSLLSAVQQVQGLVYVEMFFDPQAHTSRGIDFGTVIGGLRRAQETAEERLGIRSQLIMCFLRHLDEASAFATLEQAMPYLDRIEGVGLDSSELGHPPNKFLRVFRKAAELGLKRVAHAGEEGPPEYVWQAVEGLEVDRVDHGNRALEDSALVEKLVREKRPLTVCPQSNLRLAVVSRLSEHPIREMLAKGMMATVNSDDPAYFGAYVNDNFFALVDAVDLQADEILTLVRNSFEASFLDKESKRAHLETVESCRARLLD